MSDTRPFISVIIPVYNDHDALALCLDALEKQTYSADCYEVIVVDNNSNPPLDAVTAPFDHVRLLKESRRGSYATRNTGIAAAKGDYLAFIDSDCLPSPDWLEKGVSYLQRNPDCGLVAGRVEIFAQNPARPTAVESYELVYAFPMQHYVEEQHYAATCNLFTSRAVFNAVGPFDPTLQSGGDHEWGERVYAHGLRQIYADDMVIRHPARRTWAALARKHQRVIGGYVPTAAARRTPQRFRQQMQILLKSDLKLLQKAQALAALLFVYGLRGLGRLRRRF